MADQASLSLESLARAFARAAEQQFRSSSPLYAQLSARISHDPALLTLAAAARKDQPVPLLFLAAVHDLLLAGTPHPLAAFYPSLTAAPRRDDPYPAFRAFCWEFREPIRQLITTRRVQTNEVQRSACLLPAFELVRRAAAGSALSLVEIGASAGLNLLGNRYHYDYGAGRQCGEARSPVRLHCAVRGPVPPPVPPRFPAIAARVGVDLQPLDGRDPATARWLRALVWPGQEERARRLGQALALARQDPPPLIAGDALALLPSVLARCPREAPVCLYHAHTTYQFTPAARQQWAALIATAAREQALFHLALEWKGGAHSELAMTAFPEGKATSQLLAHCHVHGEWLQWLGTAGA